MKRFHVRTITALGLLISTEIVLSRFCSINAWNLKIGFNFLPVVIAAIFFGPLASATVAALGDFLGAVLFPIGPYFPGFTLTAFCTGLVFGLFLHKSQKLPRITFAVVVNQLVLSLCVNSLWISILYGSPYVVLLSTRLIQCAILGPIQLVSITLLVQVLSRHRKQVLA